MTSVADLGPTANVNFSMAPEPPGAPAGQDFAALFNTASGQALNTPALPPAIAPLDTPMAQRIAQAAGSIAQVQPPTAPLDKPMPDYAQGVASQLPADLRDEYSRATMNGEVSGASHFGEVAGGAFWGATQGVNPPTGSDTVDDRAGLATSAAKAIASQLPSHEDLIDYGAALSHNALGAVTPDTVNVIKSNLLDHWSDTGEMPAVAYGKALSDPVFKEQLTSPQIMPPEPLSPTELAAWDKAAHAPLTEQPITDPLGSMSTSPLLPNAIQAAGNAAMDQAVKVPGDFFQTVFGTPMEKGESVAYHVGRFIGGEPLGNDMAAMIESAGGRMGELGGLGEVPMAGTKLGREAALSHLAVVRHVFNDLAEDTSGALKGGAGAVSEEATAEAAARQATDAVRKQLTQSFPAALKTGLGRLLGDNGAEFGMQTITEQTGIAERFKRATAIALDTFRGAIEKEMPEFQAYLKDRQASYRLTQAIKAGGGKVSDFNPGVPLNKPIVMQLIDFMEGRSTGAQFPKDHPLYPLADALRGVADDVKAQMIALHPEMAAPEGWAGLPGFIEDYYRHLWLRPGAVSRFFGSGRQGDPSSWNQRRIPTFGDGLEMGLTPRLPNPIDNMIHYMAGMRDYIAAERIRRISHDAGYIHYGFKPPEEGMMALDGRASAVSGPNVGGAVQRAWAPATFATVYNRWIGRGFLDMPLGYKQFKTTGYYPAFLHLSNAELGLKLGLSGFHLGNIILATGASKVAEAMGSIGRAIGSKDMGQISMGIKQMFDPVTSLVYRNAAGELRIGLGHGRGSRITDAYYHPLMEEPSVNPGLTRLYRVGDRPGAAPRGAAFDRQPTPFAGQWFTDNKADTKFYLEDKGRGNHLSYVDVPTEEAEQYRLSNNPDKQYAVRYADDGTLTHAAPSKYSKSPETEFVIPPNVSDKYGVQSLGDNSDPWAQEMADWQARSGLRIGQRGGEYTLSGYDNMLRTIRDGGLAKLVQQAKDEPFKFMLSAIPRILDIPIAPMFDTLIPNLKAAHWANEGESWLRANPQATEAQRIAYGQYLTKSIDNRFGEMNQDMLFWNRMAQQTLNAVTVSLGWEYGTLRAMAMGVREAVPIGTLGTANLRYLTAYPMVLAAASTMYQYLKTGTTPRGFWEAMTPRTGGYTPDSNPPKSGYYQHANFASEFNVFTSLYHQFMQVPLTDPGYFIRTHLNPLTGTIAHQVFSGQPLDKRWATFKHDLLDMVTPAVIKSIFENRKRLDNVSDFERVMGMRPSSVWWDESKKLEATPAYNQTQTVGQQKLHDLIIQRLQQNEAAPP